MSKRRTDTPLPYSKVCDLVGDELHLAPYYQTIDQTPGALEGQHSIRRWEYAMALRTIWNWSLSDHTCHQESLQVADVGGAGSNFWKLLTLKVTPETLTLIDPNAPEAVAPCTVYRGTVEEYAAAQPHDQFDVLTCISVIEHVPEPRRFFRACRLLLKPGGLLFLTTDYWNREGPDTAHFHWMRERIYNQDSFRKLLADARELGFSSYGSGDWTYAGDQLYDYSIVSAALVKK